MSYGYKSEDSEGIDLTHLHERNRSIASRSANRYLKRVSYANRVPYFPDLADSPRTPLPTDWCFGLVFDYGEHDPDNPHPVRSRADGAAAATRSRPIAPASRCAPIACASVS